MDEDLMKSLLKRAKGYRYNEVQEEYSVKEDGEFVLTKKKIVRKYCPPDSSALKTYMDISAHNDTASWSDEELEKEKKKLIDKIKDDIRKDDQNKK